MWPSLPCFHQLLCVHDTWPCLIAPFLCFFAAESELLFFFAPVIPQVRLFHFSFAGHLHIWPACYLLEVVWLKFAPLFVISKFSKIQSRVLTLKLSDGAVKDFSCRACTRLPGPSSRSSLCLWNISLPSGTRHSSLCLQKMTWPSLFKGFGLSGPSLYFFNTRWRFSFIKSNIFLFL